MKRTMIACGIAALCFMSSVADFCSAGIGVMVSDNADFGWQANVPENGVIDWRWEDATEATVTVVSLLEGKTYPSVTVARSGAEKYGSLSLPDVSDAETGLYDLTVTLNNGETLQARVARPAVSTTIRSQVPDRKWRCTGDAFERKLFAYDGSWFPGFEDATTASYSVDGVVYGVPAARGFGVVDSGPIMKTDPFPFVLGFDGLTAFSASLRLPGNFVIHFK